MRGWPELRYVVSMLPRTPWMSMSTDLPVAVRLTLSLRSPGSRSPGSRANYKFHDVNFFLLLPTPDHFRLIIRFDGIPVGATRPDHLPLGFVRSCIPGSVANAGTVSFRGYK